MASKDNHKEGDSTNNPELWSSSKLLETSLSSLSRILSESLSQRRILAVYLKWLEIHRLHPSDLSKHWDNTLMHWSQSLRLRGFDKDELIIEIKKWKEDNSPLQSPQSVWPLRRYPPTPYDIAKGWPDSEHKRYSSSSGTGKQDPYRPGIYPQPLGFSGKPPGGYVCNRCATSGHFLEVCPTNMDPSFDRAPGMFYVCPICRVRGTHYKSLCPLNTDQFSIIQKRRHHGIETPDNSDSIIRRDWEKDTEKHDLFGGRSRNRSWEPNSGSSLFRASPNLSPSDSTRSPSPNYNSATGRSTEEIMEKIKEIDGMKMYIQQSDSIGREDVEMIKNSVDSGRTLQKRTRVPSPDSAGTCSRRSIDGKSPSATKARVLRNNIAAIEAVEEKGPQTFTTRPTMYTADKAALLAELYEVGNNPGRMDRDYDVDTKMEDSDGGFDGVAVDNNVPSFKRSTSNYSPHRISSSKETPEEMDVDQDQKPAPHKAKAVKHCDFVQKLIDRRPEMKETVNPIRRRPTALDMWNDDDERRLKQMITSSSKKTPSLASLGDEYEHLAKSHVRDISPVREMDGSSDKKLATKPFNSLNTPFDAPKNKESMKPISERPQH